MSSPTYPVPQASFIVGLVKWAPQGKSLSTMLESSPPCSGVWNCIRSQLLS